MNISAEIGRLNSISRSPEEETAFWTLIREYVSRMANSRLSPDALEDVVQECMLVIFTKKDQIEQPLPSSLTRWISGVVANKCADARKVDVKALQVFESLGADDPDSQDSESKLDMLEAEALEESGLSVEDEAARQLDLKQLLARIRKKIPEEDRPLWRLLRSGMTQKDAATRLGMDQDTVRKRMDEWAARYRFRHVYPFKTQSGQSVLVPKSYRQPISTELKIIHRQILDMVRDGLNRTEIADKLGMTRRKLQDILGYLKKISSRRPDIAELLKRNAGLKRKKRVADLTPKIESMLREGKSERAISGKLRCDRRTVASVRKRAGIAPLHPHQARKGITDAC